MSIRPSGEPGRKGRKSLRGRSSRQGCTQKSWKTIPPGILVRIKEVDLTIMKEGEHRK